MLVTMGGRFTCSPDRLAKGYIGKSVNSNPGCQNTDVKRMQKKTETGNVTAFGKKRFGALGGTICGDDSGICGEEESLEKRER